MQTYDGSPDIVVRLLLALLKNPASRFPSPLQCITMPIPRMCRQALCLDFDRITRDTWRLMSGAGLSQFALITLRLVRPNVMAFIGQFQVMMQKRKGHG